MTITKGNLSSLFSFYLELDGHKPKDKIVHNKRISLAAVQKQLLHIFNSWNMMKLKK